MGHAQIISIVSNLRNPYKVISSAASTSISSDIIFPVNDDLSIS
jgi:hypothetical protein